MINHRSLNKNKKIKGVQCQKCLDIIWSRYVHDFRYCSCGNSFIDGGGEYVRCGGDPLPLSANITIILEKEKTDVPSNTKGRDVQRRGSRKQPSVRSGKKSRS